MFVKHPFFLQHMALEILYEDNHLIAVNKPAGILVQGDVTRDETLPEMVKAYLKEKYDKPGKVFLGVTHRIDRPVSGVVLFGRTTKATRRVNEAFRKREVQKTYLAIVENPPPKQQDTLKAYLVKNRKLNKSFTTEPGKREYRKAKPSELFYRWIGSSDNYHLLEIRPVTGRHHQIRVMLSSIGCIIKGDLKYGAKRSNADGCISLHSRKLELVHPVRNEAMVLVAGLPDSDIWPVMAPLV